MKKVSYLVLSLILISCVEPFDFSIEGNENILIVEAVLTDEQKTHQVTLSTVRGLANEQALDTIRYVTGATVWVEDGNSSKTYYEEQSAGIYRSVGLFSGTVGANYVLHIETPDGKSYYSSEELMNPGIPMDSLYFRYDERPSEESGQKLKGVQFFVDTQHINQANVDFKYEYTESYEIIMPVVSSYVLNRETEEILTRESPIDVCYKSIRSNQILTVSTSGLSQPVISEYPIRYVTDDESQIKNDYLLVVKQRTISSNAYQFYKNLKENNQSAGSFFDKQKGTVIGNITEVGNEETIVLGYFEVGGVSVKARRFSVGEFTRAGLYVDRTNNYCTNDASIAVGIDSLFSWMNSAYNIERHIPPPSIDQPSPGVYVSPTSCTDCRTLGGLQKPKYWE